MKKVIASMLFIMGAFFISSPNLKSKGIINLEVVDLKNNDGRVKISVFNSENGFPDENEKAVRLLSEEIKDGKVTLKLEGLEAGEYAVAVLHDENDNNKMDVTFYGKPKEGFGFSNNPRLKIGPPKFSKAKFQHTAEGCDVQIKTKYY